MAQTVIAYVIGAVLFLLALLLFARPLKAVLKIILNSAIGCVLIMVFNFFGGLAGLFIGVNAATALTVGILGIPGFVMLLILEGIFSL